MINKTPTLKQRPRLHQWLWIHLTTTSMWVKKTWLPCCIHAYTCSVHLYWWKRQVSHQMWPSGSLYANKKEYRQEIHSVFETHEEGHTKSKTGALSVSTKWPWSNTIFLKNKKSLKQDVDFAIKYRRTGPQLLFQRNLNQDVVKKRSSTFYIVHKFCVT